MASDVLDAALALYNEANPNGTTVLNLTGLDFPHTLIQSANANLTYQVEQMHVDLQLNDLKMEMVDRYNLTMSMTIPRIAVRTLIAYELFSGHLVSGYNLIGKLNATTAFLNVALKSNIYVEVDDRNAQAAPYRDWTRIAIPKIQISLLDIGLDWERLLEVHLEEDAEPFDHALMEVINNFTMAFLKQPAWRRIMEGYARTHVRSILNSMLEDRIQTRMLPREEKQPPWWSFLIHIPVASWFAIAAAATLLPFWLVFAFCGRKRRCFAPLALGSGQHVPMWAAYGVPLLVCASILFAMSALVSDMARVNVFFTVGKTSIRYGSEGEVYALNFFTSLSSLWNKGFFTLAILLVLAAAFLLARKCFICYVWIGSTFRRRTKAVELLHITGSVPLFVVLVIYIVSVLMVLDISSLKNGRIREYLNTNLLMQVRGRVHLNWGTHAFFLSTILSLIAGSMVHHYEQERLRILHEKEANKTSMVQADIWGVAPAHELFYWSHSRKLTLTPRDNVMTRTPSPLDSTLLETEEKNPQSFASSRWHKMLIMLIWLMAFFFFFVGMMFPFVHVKHYNFASRINDEHIRSYSLLDFLYAHRYSDSPFRIESFCYAFICELIVVTATLASHALFGLVWLIGPTCRSSHPMLFRFADHSHAWSGFGTFITAFFVSTMRRIEFPRDEITDNAVLLQLLEFLNMGEQMQKIDVTWDAPSYILGASFLFQLVTFLHLRSLFKSHSATQQCTKE